MGNNLSLKSVFLPCGISPPCADSYFSLDGDGDHDYHNNNNTNTKKNNNISNKIKQNNNISNKIKQNNNISNNIKNYHSIGETTSNPYSLTKEDFTVAEISTCDFCKNENIKVHRIQTIGNDKNYYLVCRACNNICNNEIYI